MGRQAKLITMQQENSMGKGEAGLTNYIAAGNHSMGKGEASQINNIAAGNHNMGKGGGKSNKLHCSRKSQHG